MNKKGFIDMDIIMESPAVIALALAGGGISWFLASKMVEGAILPIIIGLLGIVAGGIMAAAIASR